MSRWEAYNKYAFDKQEFIAAIKRAQYFFAINLLLRSFGLGIRKSYDGRRRHMSIQLCYNYFSSRRKSLIVFDSSWI